MSLAIYVHHDPLRSRLYLSRSLSANELNIHVLQQSDGIIGSGITVYSSFLGRIGEITGIATRWQTTAGTFYLNTQSLKKFFYRMFLIHPSDETFHHRIRSLGEHLRLPASPLSLGSTSQKSKEWMYDMHQKYILLRAEGYDSELLDAENINFLLEALGRS